MFLQLALPGLELLCDGEGNLHGLGVVESRVAVRLVVVREIRLLQVLGSADTLGDVLSRELEVQTTHPAVHTLMHLEGASNLLHHATETTRLKPSLCALGVAVHGVAAPHHREVGFAHGGDVSWEELLDLVRTKPSDEHHFARILLRVRPEAANTLHHLGRFCRRPDLDADGVSETTEELDVSAIQRACSISNPHKVSTQIEPFVLPFMNKRLFIGEMQSFVRREQVHLLQLWFLPCAASFHERIGILDALDHLKVLLVVPDLLVHESEIPTLRLVEIGEAREEQSTRVVDRGSAVKVRLLQPLGIGVAIACVETVDVVSSEGWVHNALNGLCRTRPRFGKLSSHPPDSNRWNLRAPGQDETHLKQNLELVFNCFLVAVEEPLCAITTLQQKPLPLRHFRELPSQFLHLERNNQRWERA
mmetsp:Transcript_26844/g.58209  ORF Transcript_26844/g.58209 Transcript_26844/m.58209 type:complete len:419 (+) Transcript_26844:29-1285(+)